MDRTNLFLGLFLMVLLFVLYFFPSQRQPLQQAAIKDGDNEGQQLTNFEKIIKSMSTMEHRLQKLEENVVDVQNSQKSFQLILTELQRNKKALEHEKQPKVNIELKNFHGEIKRGKFCFDSAEHGLDGLIEIWECHKQGGNQEFEWYKNTIRHKSWCLAIEKASEGSALVLKRCGDEQWILEWIYKDHLLKAGGTNLCLMNENNVGKITLSVCDVGNTSQRWYLKSTSS